MTTIAYRDGVLAADSMSAAGGLVISRKVTKIAKGPKGHLGAAAGSAVFCENWLRYVRGEIKKAPAPEALDRDGNGDLGILVHPDGKVEMFEHAGSYMTDYPYMAEGCGSSVAMGALWMGATAEQAVQAAIEHDTHTGGEVLTVRLEDR